MKQVFFLGSSDEEIKKFPKEVREEVGFALYLAQMGDKALNAIPLSGFGNSKVPEIIVDHMGDTYRSVYTVRYEEAVYVLHAFKKKSPRGSETPQRDMNLIKSRLKIAEAHYDENFLKRQIERKKNVKS
ncbi:type II toxin-antitoxin system RelE/ParE family toxin [Agrobacterium radiobacter]|uniref:type II toxin-antitoxin system RelE/ParE family toxin n=1 Tax=Agrobacterium radiobacter TaxID=362 RepID=UPI003CEF2FF2